MRGFQNGVARVGDELCFALGIGTPQQEHHRGVFLIHRLDDRVGEGFPALALVRVGLVGAHRQHGIQQQHAPLGPRHQMPVVGDAKTNIVAQLFVDIHQGGRGRHARAHREGQSVGLARLVVGVLPDDHHAHVLVGRVVQGVEHVRAGWVHGVFAAFFAYKLIQGLVVGFVLFGAQRGHPAIGDRHKDILLLTLFFWVEEIHDNLTHFFFAIGDIG